MSKISDTVLQQALGLSPISKAQLIEELLASLDLPDSSLDKLWAVEADARVKSYDLGEIRASSAEKVLAKYTSS